MINTLKKLAMVSRPVSWVNTAYPFAAGYIMTGGQINPTFVIATLYFLIPYNLLMYGVNDVFDYESDIRNPRKGGIEGMREQRKFHPTIIVAAAVSNIPPLVYLLITQSLTAGITLTILTFFVVAYSIAKLRFKEVPFLDSVTSSIHFVGPLVYALTLTQFNSDTWPIILSFFFWGMASHAFGAVQDIIPDRAGSLSSIATWAGAQNTTRLVIVLYLAASVILFAQGDLAAIVGLAGLAYVANVLPYRNVTDATSASTNAAWRRFIGLNLFTGFIVTIVLIVSRLVA